MKLTSEWTWTGSNPIIGCAISFEFAGPFSQQAFEAIGKLHSSFRKRLPRRNIQQMLMMQIGPPGPMPVQIPQQAGIVFDRLKGDGSPEASLSVVMNMVTYMTTIYTRWDEVWREAVAVIEPIASVLAAEHPVSGLTVEYTDRFLMPGRDTASRPVRRLLASNPFIADNIFNCEGLWHCNHGFFRNLDTLPGCRLLENVNFGLSETEVDDVGPSLSLDIGINQKVMFNEPRKLEPGAIFIAGDGLVGLEGVVSTVHLRNKQILSTLLLPSVRSRIPGLDQP